MDGLLTEIKATSKDREDEFIIKQSTAPEQVRVLTRPAKTQQQPNVLSSQTNVSWKADDIITTLRVEPDLDYILQVIKALEQVGDDSELNLALPGPRQAALTFVLVERCIPTAWQLLDEIDRQTFTRCLTSVCGINTILAKLSQLSRVAKVQQSAAQRIHELLEIVTYLLRDTHALRRIWSRLSNRQQDTTKHTLACKEVVNLFGSSKVTSVPAEAYQVLKDADAAGSVSVVNGREHTEWLARNIFELATEPQAYAMSAQLLGRALSLGYNEALASVLVRAAYENKADGFSRLSGVTAHLQGTAKRRYLEAIVVWLESVAWHGDGGTPTPAVRSSIAALLQLLVSKDDAMMLQLAAMVNDPQASTIITAVRQAAIILLHAEPSYDLSLILEKSMSIFGDRLFIDHAPAQQQEAMAQNILISAGLLHRSRPSILVSMLRGSRHLETVSNRLGSSSTRARWLGMIVGTAISTLIDKPGTKMNFGTSDMNTEEAREWLNLITVQTSIGSVDALFTALDTSRKDQRLATRRMVEELPVIGGKQTFGPLRPPGMQQHDIHGDRVTEISDESDADDDLAPYAKPDSDPEDSDEDATLVNRNKVRPPVYIRNLMAMLRETENVEKFQMALKHAAPLIRRKTGFGNEVSDHAEELARILANLQDPFETEDFDTNRLQALIAVVLSDVTRVAPWLARQAFAKDYSIAQRAIMLTALGLSGRELAGYKHEDQLNPSLGNTAFPTKQLPSRLHNIYATAAPIEAAAKSIESSIIQPMALAAADQTTSHLDAVKVRKFSSRPNVERSKGVPAANELAKIFYTAYFSPLMSAFQQNLASNGDVSIYSASSVLLATFLKTVSLLLHASGPATARLDQVTIEFWDLLLYLRVKAVGDISVMEALLFSLLTLLEVHDNRRVLATDYPKHLMETKEWAEMVFERTGGGNLIEGEGEEARLRTLCAGVLTKVGDVISSYQKDLMAGWSNID